MDLKTTKLARKVLLAKYLISKITLSSNAGVWSLWRPKAVK